MNVVDEDLEGAHVFEDHNEENSIMIAALKIGGKALQVLYALLAVVVISAFAVGVFVTATNQKLSNLQLIVREIKVELVTDLRTRVGNLENTIASGVLPRAERDLEDLESRVQVLERDD